MNAETLRNEWEKKIGGDQKETYEDDGVYLEKYVEHLENIVLKLMDERVCPKEGCSNYTLDVCLYGHDGNCEFCSRNGNADHFTPKEEGR